MSQNVVPKTTQSNINEFNRFLNNNTLFIHEKYDEHYHQKISLLDLNNQPALQYTLTFIYDIFSFQKYQKDTKLNKTLRSSLIVNIKSFVNNKQTKNKQEPFTKEIAIELLKYCIENNDMFAVHYDKKNRPEKSKKQQKQEIQQPQITQKQEQLKSPLSEKKSNKGKQEIQQEQPNSEDLLRKSININDKLNKDYQSVENEENKFIAEENEFQINEKQFRGQKLLNIQLVKRQLKDVFQFYCKQLQNVNPNITFDSISQKSHTMTIGKFLTFSNAANILFSKDKAFSEGKVEKQTIINLFKKKAEGKSQIDFKLFLEILDQLYQIDKNIYTRMGLGQEGQKGRLKFIQKLKYLILPFTTRDPQGREKHIHGKVFVPKLTTHSGKIQQDLRNELQSRKQKPIISNNIMKSSQSKYSVSRAKILSSRINQKQVPNNTTFTQKIQTRNTQNQNKHDYRFLSKLICSEDTDEIFLKDYGIDRMQDHSISDARQQRRNDQDHKQIKHSQKLVLPLIKTRKQQSIERRTQLPPNRRYSNYH